MTATTKRRCRQCGRVRPTRIVQRFGNHIELPNGHWRKGHWRPASICEECAHAVLREDHPEPASAALWSVRGLQRAWKIKETA